MARSNDQFWLEFVKQHLENYVNSVDQVDKKPGAAELINDINYVGNMPPREAVKYLRTYLSDEAVKRFSERFRADKYRKKNKKKTLQINSLTHHKIMDFRDIIEADTVDEALDMLFSKKYNQEVDAAQDVFSERVYDEDDAFIGRLANRLKPNDRQRLLLIVEQAFRDGWKAAKSSRQRKGSPATEALEANEQYITVKKMVPA